MTTKFTEQDEATISHALHTAAERYRECSTTISASDLPADAKARLVDQFARQVRDCQNLLAKMEG